MLLKDVYLVSGRDSSTITEAVWYKLSFRQIDGVIEQEEGILTLQRAVSQISEEYLGHLGRIFKND